MSDYWDRYGAEHDRRDRIPDEDLDEHDLDGRGRYGLRRPSPGKVTRTQQLGGLRRYGLRRPAPGKVTLTQHLQYTPPPPALAAGVVQAKSSGVPPLRQRLVDLLTAGREEPEATDDGPVEPADREQEGGADLADMMDAGDHTIGDEGATPDGGTDAGVPPLRQRLVDLLTAGREEPTGRQGGEEEGGVGSIGEAPGEDPLPTADPNAPVQAKSAGMTADPDEVHAAAAQGVQGSGELLPHFAKIQKSFDAHDLSGVRAHIGGKAADAATAIGASAFATGNEVAFEKAPDLHTAAHEAAHVVQQRAGVQLLGGVGEAGDKYERQADAVGDAVVRGESVEELLGGTREAGAASETTSRIQRKDSSGSRVGTTSSAATPSKIADPKDIAPGASVRFKGLRVQHLVPSLAVPPRELPPRQVLYAKLAALRPLEPHFAARALQSVASRPEARFLRPILETDKGAQVELPASYIGNPPTLEVAQFIGLHYAVAVIEWLIDEDAKRASDKQLRIDEVGGKPIQGTKKAIEQYRWRLIVQQTLGGLTGSFGGVVGFMVANWLGASPKQIAAATEFGENALGAFGYAKQLGPKRRQPDKGQDSKPRARDIPIVRRGPKVAPTRQPRKFDGKKQGSATSKPARGGETESTSIGKEVHKQQAANRRKSGHFDLVQSPIKDRNGNPILVSKRVDLKSGKPKPGKKQKTIPDAVSFDRRLVIDDKPLGRKLSKDRQEIIRFIRAYTKREGHPPKTIAIQRYDPKTGKPVHTELYSPADFMPRGRQ